MTNDNTTTEITADELEQLRRKAEAYDRERRASREAYEREADNRERCRRFAEELEAYVDGLGYYDPDAREYCVAEDHDEIPEDAEPADYWDANEAYDEAAAAICDELGAGRYCPVSGLDAATVLAVLEWRGGIRAAVSGNPRRRGGNVWAAGDDEALRLLGFEWSERRRMWWVHCDRLGGAETAPTRQIKALAA